MNLTYFQKFLHHLWSDSSCWTCHDYIFSLIALHVSKCRRVRFFLFWIQWRHTKTTTKAPSPASHPCPPYFVLNSSNFCWFSAGSLIAWLRPIDLGTPGPGCCRCCCYDCWAQVFDQRYRRLKVLHVLHLNKLNLFIINSNY